MQLSSTSTGTVVSIEAYDIHGQPNIVVRYRLERGGDLREARLAAECVFGEPRAGDRITVQMVLGEAFEIRRA